MEATDLAIHGIRSYQIRGNDDYVHIHAYICIAIAYMQHLVWFVHQHVYITDHILTWPILFHRASLFIILKPYVKSVTHSEKLEWWNILMVECVTILH